VGIWLSCLCALTTIVFLALLPETCRADAADQITIEAEGIGALAELPLATARTYAVENALSEAFRAALRSLLSASQSSVQLQELWRRLDAQRDECIIKYGIIKESSDAEFLRITIRATFAAPLLAKKLRALGYSPVEARKLPETIITLTVDNIQSYEEYMAVRDFLNSQPCIRQHRPLSLYLHEASFLLNVDGGISCLTEAESIIVVKEVMENMIRSDFRHLK
jgi:hypothetical protein